MHTNPSSEPSRVDYLPDGDMLSDRFAGRDKYIQDLTSRFFPGVDVSSSITQGLLSSPLASGNRRLFVPSVRVAVHGIQGVGKTQLLLKYIHHSRLLYKHKFYLKQSTRQGLLGEYRSLAGLLRLCQYRPDESEDQHVIEAVKNWLRDNQNWLLVFDNAHDSSVVLEFTPMEAGGHILFGTVNEITARQMSKKENLIELQPFTTDEARAVCFHILDEKRPKHSEVKAVEELATFSRGLPLLLAPVIINAKYQRRTLAEVMRNIKDTKILFEQKHKDSLLGEQSAVCAFLKVAMDHIALRNQGAVALLKLLAYFDVASIPLEIISKGGPELEVHFERPYLYDRGAIRLKDEKIVNRQAHEDGPARIKSPSHMRALLRHTSTAPKASTEMPLRPDSESDIAIKRFLEEEKYIKPLLQDSQLLHNAIVHLRDAGLLRLPSISADTVWLHELHALLLRAMVESDSAHLNRVHAHLGLALVYLTFPTPQPLRLVLDRCLLCFPHAVTMIRRCCNLSAGIKSRNQAPSLTLYEDSTIAPEVAHMIAATIELDPEAGKLIDSTRTRKEAMTWYRLAWRGYTHCHWRWEASAGRLGADTLQMIRDDNECTEAYRSTWWRKTRGHERFGTLPLRRRDDTALRLVASVLDDAEADLRDLEFAKQLALTMSQMLEILYSPTDEHVDEVLEMVCQLCRRLNSPNEVLYFVVRRTKNWCTRMNGGLINSRAGATLARELGEACCALRRLDEAVYWHEISYQALRYLQGEDRYCARILRDLANMELFRGGYLRAKELGDMAMKADLLNFEEDSDTISFHYFYTMRYEKAIFDWEVDGLLKMRRRLLGRETDADGISDADARASFEQDDFVKQCMLPVDAKLATIQFYHKHKEITNYVNQHVDDIMEGLTAAFQEMDDAYEFEATEQVNAQEEEVVMAQELESPAARIELAQVVEASSLEAMANTVLQ